MKTNLEEDSLDERRLLRKRFRNSVVFTITFLSVILLIIYASIQSKQELNVVESQLLKKDSTNSKLVDSIKHFKVEPKFKPIAYAIPTGRVSNPGVHSNENSLPEFAFYLCVLANDSINQKIKKVEYHFDHPSFRNKLQTSKTSADSFKVGYTGWGCLYNVNIYIHITGEKTDTINFAMCDKLQLQLPNQ